jgi:hypothetical protein
MWITPLTESAALDWVNFRIEDIDLLHFSRIPLSNEPAAVCVLSVNSSLEILPMLSATGEIFQHSGGHLFVFRSDNLTVLKWSRKYNGERHEKPNHRPRWLGDSEKWRSLCVRAYLRSL